MTGTTEVLDPVLVTTSSEEALVGALMHQPLFFAGAVLRRVMEDDLSDPRLRAVWRWAGELVAKGVAPDPAAVYAEARRCGDVHGEQRLSALTKLLTDVYTRCPIPDAWDHYAACVLDGALRRRILQAGQRLAQVAEESALEDAMHVVSDEIQALYAMFARRKKALEVGADG